LAAPPRQEQPAQAGASLRTRIVTLILFAVVVYPLVVDVSYLTPSLVFLRNSIGAPYADASSSLLLNAVMVVGGSLTIIYLSRTAPRGVLPKSQLQAHLDRAKPSTSMDSPEAVVIYPTSDDLNEEEEDSEAALILSRGNLRGVEIWKDKDEEEHQVKLVLTHDQGDATFLSTFARVMRIAGYSETPAYPEFLRHLPRAAEPNDGNGGEEQVLLFNVEKRGGYPYSKLEPPSHGNILRNVAIALEEADYAMVQILFCSSDAWADSARTMGAALKDLDEERRQLHSAFAQEAAKWGLLPHSALSIRGFAIAANPGMVYDALNAAVSGMSGIFDGLTVRRCTNPLLVSYILERSIPEFTGEVGSFDKGVFKRWKNFSVIPILTSELAMFLRMPHAETSVQDRIEYRPSVLEPQAISGKRADHFIEL
jgi:hypothetical protein